MSVIVRRLWTRVAPSMLCAWLASACGDDFSGPGLSGGRPTPAGGVPVAADAPPPMGGATAAGQGACTVGETRDCSCDEPDTRGMQECIFDFSSPTRGSYGPCTDCRPVEPAADACVRGDLRRCICEASGDPGIQVCLFAPSTPMQGTFSDCRNCGEAWADFDGGV